MRNEAITRNPTTGFRAYDNDPDRLLVERALDGDMKAFEQLVLQNERRIFRTILGITKTREDAEDQTQETFIRAYRNLKYFRGDSKFKTWLTRIAVNQALMCLRKRHTENVSCIRPSADEGEHSTLLDIAGPGPNPEQHWVVAELGNRLSNEINKLPQKLRSAFVLQYIHEYTVVEAAVTLGISSAAFKTRALRARRRLCERIEGYAKVRGEIKKFQIRSQHRS